MFCGTEHSWGVEPDFKGTLSLHAKGLVELLNTVGPKVA